MGAVTSKQEVIGKVSEINIYPLKSGRGYSVETAEIWESGLKGDREFVLVDETGNFTSQRKIPSMATLALTIPDRTRLLISYGGKEIYAGPLVEDGTVETLTIWGKGVPGTFQGEASSTAISNALNVPGLRLFWAGPSQARRVESGFAVGNEHFVKYADGYPFLLTTTASLADLNSKVDTSVPMNRFRPSIVVDGDFPAWAEESWRQIKINNVTYQACKKCARCKVPTVDQATGEADSGESMKVLKAYRSVKSQVFFGMNLVHEEKKGSINVGDDVVLVS
uniref:MOSC domain-containing protein n=1 Tax=Rhodosorus marinus TaxID=101924 RepID=A0A7S0G7A8_9RHOD|mmetsp:Transcript_8840/g.12916  ORF Transcript_8840/g.12916 Transcript_8840/m.12916 type:complete len:280 (+) Transcript_8840:142-981(+)|eukprot:CAMPEP_0184745634 /NCGR_PEP_ID=MMETSP0315-20130426/8296_1 /TAXON_ID=101924 /ORGANISM="Rhodosorus marinus, Strain UTEX LB 2760" /LENGTH=279 /DNA_ID=CAMNT_0027217887 /DNA_START=76 /DNA_END=915 /DNA_ORIENTATION=-